MSDKIKKKMKVENDADIPDNNFSNMHGHQHKHMHPTHEKYKKIIT